MARPQFKKFALHEHILPSLQMHTAHSDILKVVEDPQFFDVLAADMQEAVVFDGRMLPGNFIFDTGKVALEEIEELRQQVRLPFPICYFEFEDLSVYAVEVRLLQTADGVAEEYYSYDDNDPVLATTVKFYVLGGWDEYGKSICAANQLFSYGRFLNGYDGNEYATWGEFDCAILIAKVLEFANYDSDLQAVPKSTRDEMVKARGQTLAIGARMLTGVLTLLNEKYLLQESQPDPAPRLTAARAKRGKPPVTVPSRMLTINVASVQAAASGNKLGTHESPLLHWRRGHWRHLHRDLPNAKRVWINRMLVGDPAKGYLSPHDFNLIWSPSVPSELVNG